VGVKHLEIRPVMEKLAVRRPIFHSEADFQHELAWELRQSIPDCEVRLERPITGAFRGAVDIVILWQGVHYGLELKYLTQKLDTVHNSETFNLKAHGATDLRRYDVCKDIWRLENFNDAYGGRSMVVVLTNEAAYWKTPQHDRHFDAAFRVFEGRRIFGNLGWDISASPGTTKGRTIDINLRGEYQMLWQDYSDFPKTAGRFRYLLVEVA
jgi:hypothetical protein